MIKRQLLRYYVSLSHDIGYNPNLLKDFYAGISVSFTGIIEMFFIFTFSAHIARSKET